MKATSTPVMQLILPLAIAAIALVCGLGILHWYADLAHADNYLFCQLITGATHPDNKHIQPNLGGAVLVAIFAVASAFAGYKLGPRASIVALLQLFVLAIFCQWLLWKCWGVSSHPLGLFIAMATALFLSRIIKSTSSHSSNLQTRSYELMLRNLELKKTQLQVVHHDEVERRLLAADLHDEVLNDLKMAKQKLADYIKAPSSATATEIENRISVAMEEIHEVMDHLCPSVLEHLGLPAAVEELLHNACRSSGMRKHFNNDLVESDLDTLSSTKQALLYRLVQESVNNACKHACGKTLAIDMTKESSEIVIRIQDDGKGVDLNTFHNGNSRGIRYMKQRADLIGAKIAWHHNSSTSSGTMVEIRLPLSQ
jgi:signal transduction histidine kinase